MRGLFSFDAFLPSAPRRRIRLLYCSIFQPSEDAFIELLQRDEELPQADEIRLLAPVSERNAIDSAIDSSRFQSRFGASARIPNRPKVEKSYFDEVGRITPESAFISDSDLLQLRRVGMTSIFKSRGGLLEAPGGYHYAKPSGGHAEKFLRIGNIMVSGAEIDFLAFSCLPLVPIDLSHIYCDTGAIHPVAFAIAGLRRRIRVDCSMPTVDSFGSYEGLATFTFADAQRSLVLLSASTSGRLAAKVQQREPNFSQDRIVTLFYLGTKDVPQVVCALRRNPLSNPDGLEPFVTYDENSCELCARDSTLIQIDGDHFLPGAAKTEKIRIRAEDAPAWLSGTLQNLKDKQVVRVNYRDPRTMICHEVFFDLAKLFADDSLLNIDRLKERFDWMVRQNVPADIRRIIFLDDASSEEMARAVQRRLPAAIRESVELIRFREIKLDPTKYVQSDGATLVVASAASSGRSLIGVSKILRTIQPNQAIQYFIGFAKVPTKVMLEELRSNLSWWICPQDHGVWCLETLSLPLDSARRKTSWDDESEWLKKLTIYEGDARTLIENRQRELEAASGDSQKGMVDNLFWRTTADRVMQVGRGFVFVNFEYEPGTISQAETYFAITSVLHHLRNNPLRSLQQTGFVRRVLSPRCFDRFSDGVIQASILRAAFPAELDYSTTDGDSQEMTQFLEVVISHCNDDIGEAAREFALALATKKMQLRKPDFARLSKHLAESADPVLAAFGKHFLQGGENAT